MTSSTNCSDINVRPRRYRGIRSSKKSVLYSDYNTEEESKNGSLGQRSISLTALPHNGNTSVSTATTPIPSPGPLLEPRMAQLETLEAKMASIEVSLSTAQRRKNGKKNACSSASTASKTASIGGTTPASIFASIRSNTLLDTCRELEVLRNTLKDKENTIQNLQGQINCGRLTSLQPLDPSERRFAELRLQSLKQEEESRKTAIKKININLEKMDDNEANIDIRIKQAELEYELGREELGLLGVREEIRTLQARLNAKPALTLFSSINSSGKYTLNCVHLEYDPKSPRFGAGNLDDKIGLFVLWAAENSGLQKGDRILEVNGKITLSTTKEEMIRLLTVCPSKAELVILRAWVPPLTEDFLRRENLRLTHRISYLEDQVSELLHSKDKTTVPEKTTKSEEMEPEIFQKGTQISVFPLTKNGSKTNILCISNSTPKLNGDLTQVIPERNEEKAEVHKGSSNGTNETKGSNAVLINFNGYPVPVGSIQKFKEIDSSQSYQSKSRSPGEKIRSLAKKYERCELPSIMSRGRWEKNGDAIDEYHKRHFNVSSAKNGSAMENMSSLSDLERPSRKTGHYHGRLVDYSSETSCIRYKAHRDKKAETDEESVYFLKSELSEPESGRKSCKPTPPKKPIRLSINRGTSLQNVDSGYSVQNVVRKIKRSHKGEAPPPPVLCNEHKVNGSESNLCSITDSSSLRTISKIDSWKVPAESGYASLCSPSNYHSSKSKTGEKWC